MNDIGLERGLTADLAPLRRRRLAGRALLVVGVLATAAIAAGFAYDYWTVGRFTETTEDAYVGGDITVIAPKVAGFVAEVLVADNQSVRAGDPLIRLDDRDYRAALAAAEATVAGARAAIANLEARDRRQRATIAEAAAQRDAAEAELVRARDDQARYQRLAAVSAASVQSYERADAALKQAAAGRRRAMAALEGAEGELAVIASDKAKAVAALAEAEARRDTASLNLSYSVLIAPVDGVIGNRSARQGAYTAVGTQLLSLVPAAGLWVDANFKESQLAAMRPGQPAEIEADILPGVAFKGHVVSLAPATGAEFSILPAENATGNFTKIVQRVPVRIALDGDASRLGRLRPGLSVKVSVDQRGGAAQ